MQKHQYMILKRTQLGNPDKNKLYRLVIGKFDLR